EEVTLANVDDFTEVMARGWDSDPAALDPMHRRMLTDPASRCRLFLARHEGTPAAASAYTALDRSAYLMGAVTLSSFRGRGLYRALVSARLSHAAAGGLALATSVAMESTSAPILAALGFERVCSILSYTGE
ncbi:MAG: GNAT family N-acetyltransferase, partial [Polyangiaceae bacterium]